MRDETRSKSQRSPMSSFDASPFGPLEPLGSLPLIRSPVPPSGIWDPCAPHWRRLRRLRRLWGLRRRRRWLRGPPVWALFRSALAFVVAVESSSPTVLPRLCLLTPLTTAASLSSSNHARRRRTLLLWERDRSRVLVPWTDGNSRFPSPITHSASRRRYVRSSTIPRAFQTSLPTVDTADICRCRCCC